MGFRLWSLSALFHYKSKVQREPVRTYSVSNPFHAVSVDTPLKGACRAAMSAAGKRYLSAEAPSLPFAGCDAETCRCRYAHHDDRRGAPRRSADEVGNCDRPWHGAEKRVRSGRRSDDP